MDLHPLLEPLQLTPGSILTKLFSTTRAIEKLATIVIGKMAAAVPMVDPITNLVSCEMATKKIIEGNWSNNINQDVQHLKYNFIF